MKWLRRIAAAPLGLIALICAIGAARIFAHDLPDSTVGDGIFAAVAAVAAGAVVYFLLRPDLLRLRELSFEQFRDWMLWDPLGQATALYVIAATLMFAAPEYQLAPALIAMCVFSVASPWAAALQQRWWIYAGLALLGWCLLFLALFGTSEAIAPRGFGEGAMVFLLPVQLFPILLLVSGLVRWIRGVPTKP